MAKTRGQLITEKVVELEQELKKYIDNSLFPDLQEIDLADLVVYITMMFIGISTEEGYREKIQELIKMRDIKIDDATFETILPRIIQFVEWLRNL